MEYRRSFIEKLYTENIDKEFWIQLIENIDYNSFLKLDPIIGCPDCADGGTEWLEIKTKENSYKIIFKYGNEPNETKEYIEFLRTYLKSFQIDSFKNIDFNSRTIINKKGYIKNFVATRGSYQWLIGVESDKGTSYYFDKDLDQKFQVNNLKIEFNGILENDSTMIAKPSPNDIPVPDFKARNVKTLDVEIIIE